MAGCKTPALEGCRTPRRSTNAIPRTPVPASWKFFPPAIPQSRSNPHPQGSAPRPHAVEACVGVFWKKSGSTGFHSGKRDLPSTSQSPKFRRRVRRHGLLCLILSTPSLLSSPTPSLPWKDGRPNANVPPKRTAWDRPLAATQFAPGFCIEKEGSICGKQEHVLLDQFVDCL